jgi:hypothetical protein
MPRTCRCALFLPFSIPVRAETDDKQPLELVKNQACAEGGTLYAGFTNKDKRSSLDLGWKVYPGQNGAFEVERLMLLNEKSPTSYKWMVDRDGKIKAIYGKAMGVTR